MNKKQILDLIKEYKSLTITEDMADEEMHKRGNRRLEIQKLLPKEIGIALIFGKI